MKGKEYTVPWILIFDVLFFLLIANMTSPICRRKNLTSMNILRRLFVNHLMLKTWMIHKKINNKKNSHKFLVKSFTWNALGSIFTNLMSFNVLYNDSAEISGTGF